MTPQLLLAQETTQMAESDVSSLTQSTIDLCKYMIDDKVFLADFDLIRTLPNSYVRNLSPDLLESIAENSDELVLKYCLTVGLQAADDSKFIYIFGLICLWGWDKALTLLINKHKEKVLANSNSICSSSDFNYRLLDVAVAGATLQYCISKNVDDMRAYINGLRERDNLNYLRGNYPQTVRLLLEHNANPFLLADGPKRVLKSGKLTSLSGIPQLNLN